MGRGGENEESSEERRAGQGCRGCAEPAVPAALCLLFVQALRGADFIIEAVAEEEAIKKEVFRNLDKVRTARLGFFPRILVPERIMRWWQRAVAR